MNKYKITVCTPTYNRADLIHRVFDSLKVQTLSEFEWLVIDDGSSDNTEKVINSFKKSANFDINYYKKENGGKHTAVNYGLHVAKGELFLIFDSDDSCTSDALELFYNYWETYKDKNIKSIACLSVDLNNKIIGDRFPKDEFISNFIDTQFKYNISGDKWIIVKTLYFKKFLFPTFENEKFIAESSIWHKIGQDSNTLFINKPLLVHEYQDNGLSSNTVKLRKNSPKGTSYVYNNITKLDIPLKYKIKATINLYRFLFHKPKLLISNLLSTNPILTLISLPVSIIYLIKDLRN